MSILDKNIEEYYTKGFTHIKNVIPSSDYEIIGNEVVRMDALWRHENNISNGDEKDFGNGIWWKGFDMATHLSPISKEFFKSDEFYFFNDEIVIKYKQEPNKFMLHTDTEYGPQPNLDFHHINFYWILDDFTDKNGAIRFQDIREERVTEENLWLDYEDTPPGKGWEWLYPKKGDMVVFNGRTLHYSVPNLTDGDRRAWSTQYTSIPIGNLPYENSKHKCDTWKWFFSDRFINPTKRFI
jgi:hypothetical protein